MHTCMLAHLLLELSLPSLMIIVQLFQIFVTENMTRNAWADEEWDER